MKKEAPKKKAAELKIKAKGSPEKVVAAIKKLARGK